MTDRERLIQILRVPIYPHLDADPAEVVADYLLDNGVTFTPAAPGHDNQYNIAEMSYNNGYEKGFADGKNESVKRGRWIIHHAVGGRKSRVNSWAECSECRVCGSPPVEGLPGVRN